MKSLFINPVKLFMLLLLGLVLSACGDSSDNDSSSGTAILSGTAAVGAALASRLVTVVDSTGTEVTTTTDVNGKYSVTVTVSAKPFMLKVETDGEPLYSFAAEAGVSNITPLTNLALHEANKNGATYIQLSSLFSSFKDHYAQITETKLNEAKAKVNANLSSVYSGAGVAHSFDFFKTAFDANGSGIDKVLDDAGISIDSSDPGMITITVTGAGAFPFNPAIDFSQFVIGGSGNGGGEASGSCAARTTAYASVSDLFSDIAGTYVVTSITGGGGSEQTSIESYNQVEIIVSNTNLSVRACADPSDTSTCGTQLQYGGSSSWSGLTSELLGQESNLYFDYSASSLASNVYYDHATCEITVETRSMSTLINWAALHYDPAASDTGGTGSGGALSGTWDLVITGTAGGFAIPATTINNYPAAAVPTAASAGQAEQAFNSSFGAIGSVSNFNYSIVSSSATQVVATITGTVTTPAQEVNGFQIPAQSTSYDLTYTYNKI